MTNRLKLAYALAEYAHETQKRKDGSPYIYHPWAVAESVKHLGEDYQIVGVLHDVVEDTSISIKTIENIFGGVVADSVWSVTRGRSHNCVEPYDLFIEKAKQNVIGRQVKIADIKHNLSTAAGLPNDEKGLVDRWNKALKVLEEN
jgi:(p)ppGpp synthase/HD superfamily hydrolase